MTVLRVLRPGLFSLIVDRGRPAYRSLGVPVGGAADAFSPAIGNALLGNAPDEAGLEIALAGPTLFLPEEAEPLACVVSGAPFEMSLSRKGEQQPLPPGVTFTLPPGGELRIGGTARGARAYLCVAGGFQTPMVLGSRSAFRPLQTGDELPCMPGRIGGRFVAILSGESPIVGDGEGPTVLRVLPGGQASWFRRETFVGERPKDAPRFTVGPASNRMGLRLEGPALPVPERELVSEPVCPGTVQVTREGGCIVLGVDGQTIGGYPKIAQVISADLDRLGQLRPGQEVWFRQVALEEAEEAARRRSTLLSRWVTRLRCAVE
jgi:antagonist of KipI